MDETTEWGRCLTNLLILLIASIPWSLLMRSVSPQWGQMTWLGELLEKKQSIHVTVEQEGAGEQKQQENHFLRDIFSAWSLSKSGFLLH